jgi:hypothetical protein
LPSPHIEEALNCLSISKSGLPQDPTSLNRADAAKHFGVSRARVTQQLSLITNLAPESQELIDDYADYPVTRVKFTERKLKPLLYLSPVEQQDRIRELAYS